MVTGNSDFYDVRVAERPGIPQKSKVFGRRRFVFSLAASSIAAVSGIAYKYNPLGLLTTDKNNEKPSSDQPPPVALELSETDDDDISVAEAAALWPTGSGDLTAAMVVDKLTFGPKAGLIDQVEEMGLEVFIEDQLSRDKADENVEVGVNDIKPIQMSPKDCRTEKLAILVDAAICNAHGTISCRP